MTWITASTTLDLNSFSRESKGVYMSFSSRPITYTSPQRKRLIEKVVQDWKRCGYCEIGSTCFSKVFYRGRVCCQILFIGEAPGWTENLLAEPFVGRAGRLLDQLIAETQLEIPFTFGITNLIACFPHDNTSEREEAFRKPTEEEVDNCHDRLLETVHAANPKAVVFLGNEAEKASKSDKGKLLFDWRETIKLRHPSHIYRKGGRDSAEFNRFTLTLAKFIKGVLS